MKILTAQYDTILKEERIILNNLLTSLVKFQADDADTKALLRIHISIRRALLISYCW